MKNNANRKIMMKVLKNKINRKTKMEVMTAALSAFLLSTSMIAGCCVVNVNEVYANEPADEPITFQPKVIVSSSVTNPQTVCSGQEFELVVTLKNTSSTMALKNMTIVITPGEESFSLIDASDCAYTNGFYAGSEMQLIYKLKAKPGLEDGQYIIPLSFDYADTLGNPYTSQGNARINIKNQNSSDKIKMNFDQPAMPAEAQVGELINIDAGIQNLSREKVYNVRAVIEADGINATETMFVGEMEPGTSATGSTQANISGLSEGTDSFGNTTGTITFYYEDEAGNEFSEVKDIELNIVSPFTEKTVKEEDKPSQWWIIMAVISIAIVGFATTFIIRKVSRKEGA